MPQQLKHPLEWYAEYHEPDPNEPSYKAWLDLKARVEAYQQRERAIATQATRPETPAPRQGLTDSAEC
jgi:hypothetical protein